MNAAVGIYPVRQAASMVRRRSADHLVVANDLLTLWDITATVACGYLGIFVYNLTLHKGLPAVRLSGFLLRQVLLGSLVNAFVLRDRRLATLAGYAHGRLLPIGTARRVGACVVVLAAVACLSGSILTTSSAWWLCWALLSLGCSLVARACLVAAVAHARVEGRLREAVAVIGAGAVAKRLAARLAAGNEAVEVIGRFEEASELGSEAVGRVGSIEQLIELGRTRALDAVVIALPESEQGRVAGLLWHLQSLCVQVTFCPELALAGIPAAAGEAPGHTRFRVLNGVPLALAVDRPLAHWHGIVKRSEDVLVASLMLLASLPVLAVIALAIRLEDGGPVLFRQARDGWNGRDFTMLKFRTMRVDANPQGTLVQTRRDDRRITRVGAVLRRSSLDELPQLINVLRGEMSVVGPRPHALTMRTENRLCHEVIAEYAQRQRMKPGITGLAQVNGLRGATDTEEQLRRRVHHDLIYIEGWSLALDLKVILLTAFRVFRAENAF